MNPIGRIPWSAVGLAATILAVACASVPTYEQRRARADELAARRGWIGSVVSAGAFDLVVYAPADFARDERLTVYIEGDGLAWLSASRRSTDPTPRTPVGLQLALAHPAGNAAYLARPCQYVGAAAHRCDARYWGGHRFAPEVIEASDVALDVLAARFGARRLTLVGYSGGGAVAALLAARRDDVEHLVTVAGNLDPRSWTRHHKVSPLRGSLNPVDERERLAKVRQTHFVGGRDRVIPLSLARRLPVEIRGPDAIHLRVVPEFDHTCCWAERWPSLFSAP